MASPGAPRKHAHGGRMQGNDAEEATSRIFVHRSSECRTGGTSKVRKNAVTNVRGVIYNTVGDRMQFESE
eukprot:761561-Hanusia_phi.AAC.2